jgi:nucleoside-triphosphatase THEP1
MVARASYGASMAARNILVTGLPRSGKSTLIEKVVQEIERPATGFITVEIRERNRRVGFAITTLAGKTGILAHQDIKGKFRVGKYGVNLQDLDQIAVPSMQPSRPAEIIVIDEIGKMELCSALFKQKLVQVLDSEHQVIGSIALKGDRFIQGIKAREDVLLIPISEATRESALTLFLSALKG